MTKLYEPAHCSSLILMLTQHGHISLQVSFQPPSQHLLHKVEVFKSHIPELPQFHMIMEACLINLVPLRKYSKVTWDSINEGAIAIL